ncbi:DNA-binding response regulator, NarL/FixJ family, contains REC and HTH domains [Paenibacillus sp. UNCCL117]|uniref:response regulator n=1 Tax=unclassified Paenibacillus TaxID=185978 RepID=UPI00088F99FB|nr:MULTISPECIES: response regulator transcription factor [unclassified Paenibacillus]SDD29713.1 DNA-binding response regulator, NarL/FixJ family, contains REC and HTH domains [Paenibacillus sp. cl123]SFW40481.1 DNA-binding response regulator, NarL/FixJ family, contains REC and HTH domains [Paenibacillus sp. UNCCL117]
MKYRVLVADDHPLARRAVRTLLGGEKDFEWIGEASSGEEALELCPVLLPDLILMDIRMPEGGGLEATRRIKQLYPHIRVVMLTVSDDVTDLFTAVRHGAQGYLLKNMNPEDWIHYLRGLLDENSEISRGMADRLFQSFRRAGGGEHDEIAPSSLSQRENEILSYIATGQSNRQIAAALVITENTVKNHVKNILSKLALDNRVQLTAYAVRHGLTQNVQKPSEK